jgi:hypothetical protein
VLRILGRILLDRTRCARGDAAERDAEPREEPAMRIYEGSPRQDYEEVLRSVGAFIDQRAMREILLLEVQDGFVVQGLVAAGASTGEWSESYGTLVKETVTFMDEDIAKFMEDGIARRGAPEGGSGSYEHALRVIGRYIDEQKPRDVFFFEQDGAFVLRLLHTAQKGSDHVLVEFTREDVSELIARGPALRVTTSGIGA